jgi:class 3 adenylate cyclase
MLTAGLAQRRRRKTREVRVSFQADVKPFARLSPSHEAATAMFSIFGLLPRLA